MLASQNAFFSNGNGFNIRTNSLTFIGNHAAGILTSNSSGLCSSRLIQSSDIKDNSITLNNFADNIFNSITFSNGSQGATGLQGFQGLNGNLGLQGIIGLQGATGPQGEIGSQGATGLQGHIGITGIGLQGAQGAQGLTGAQGVQGEQGAQGFRGAQGEQGLIGTTGLITGTTGPQGVSLNYSTVTVSDNNGATAIYLVGVNNIGTAQNLLTDRTTGPLSYVPSTSTLSLSNLSLNGAIQNGATATDTLIRTIASSTSNIRFAPQNVNAMVIGTTGVTSFANNINLTTTSQTFTPNQLGFYKLFTGGFTVNNLVSGQIYNLFSFTLQPGVYICNLFFNAWGSSSENIINVTGGISVSSSSFVGGTGELSVSSSVVLPPNITSSTAGVGGGFSTPFVITAGTTTYYFLFRLILLNAKSVNFTGNNNRKQLTVIKIA